MGEAAGAGTPKGMVPVESCENKMQQEEKQRSSSNNSMKHVKKKLQDGGSEIKENECQQRSSMQTHSCAARAAQELIVAIGIASFDCNRNSGGIIMMWRGLQLPLNFLHAGSTVSIGAARY